MFVSSIQTSFNSGPSLDNVGLSQFGIALNENIDTADAFVIDDPYENLTLAHNTSYTLDTNVT